MASKRKQAQAQRAKSNRTFYTILAVVAVIGIGAIAYSMTRSAGMSTAPLDMSQIDDAETLLAQAQGVSIGAENAPVQMIVFSDFQCPGCAAWSSRIEVNLKRDFVDTGKLRYTYYDFPLTSIHPHAFLAARAARCANEQGRFWDFHNRLFAAQGTWSFSGSAPVSEFTEYATMSGMDVTAFTACLRSDRHANVVTANLLLGEQLGVGGTPTVFVGQRRLGDREWQDYSAVSAAIEAAGGV